MTPSASSDLAIRAALALDLPRRVTIEPAAGGASGAAWRVRDGLASYVLRITPSDPITDARLAAMSAAREASLPAPELVRRAIVGDSDAVLLSWLPGVTLVDAVRRDPGTASHWGRAMGEMQRSLHGVRAPAQLPSVPDDDGHPFSAGRRVTGISAGEALLHLDWHPLNLLVDEGSGVICGIIDWDNAHRGAPLLDVARTASILTLDPGVASLPPPERVTIAALFEGWVSGYGPEAEEIPEADERWAASVMLADLEGRYAQNPRALDPVRRKLRT